MTFSDPDYDRPEYSDRDLAADQLADHGWMCGDDCPDCAAARDVLESE